LSLSWYVSGKSFLHQATPLQKLALVAFLWVTSFVFASPLWNGALLFFTLAVLIAARVPFLSMKAYLKVIIPIMLLFLLLFPLFDRGGTVLFVLGPIVISWVGVSGGIIAASRLGALFLSTVGILLTTTRERELIDGLMKGGLPFEASFLLMLTLRFISLSMTDLMTIREARRARAMPERENLIQLLRNLVSIVVPLFIATIRRIQTSSNALEVKGFAPGAKRTSVLKGELQKSEVLTGVFFVALTAFLAVLRLKFGWFTSP
jgi:energy-coupling factor transport system permease protein